MKITQYLISYFENIKRKIQFFLSIKRIKEKHESFVIMFHHVDFENKNSEKYGINISDFKKCILQLKKYGYQFVLYSELEKKTNYKNGYCVLTFDDGFHSTYQLMKKYLTINNIPFHIFITSDWINKKEYVTQEEVIEMAREPLCSIGSHSKSHPMFRILSDENEIEEYSVSNQVISNIIHEEVVDFAFPFGSWTACSSNNIKMAYKIGYLRVFSTTPNTLRNISPRNSIPRINGVEVARYL